MLQHVLALTVGHHQGAYAAYASTCMA